MATYTLFYSDKCPDTAPFVAELQRQNIDYEAVNITETTTNLKRFLAFRDNRPEFDERKRWGLIGILVLVLPNNRLIFDLIDLNGTSCTVTPHQ